MHAVCCASKWRRVRYSHDIPMSYHWISIQCVRPNACIPTSLIRSALICCKLLCSVLIFISGYLHMNMHNLQAKNSTGLNLSGICLLKLNLRRLWLHAGIKLGPQGMDKMQSQTHLLSSDDNLPLCCLWFLFFYLVFN